MEYLDNLYEFGINAGALGGKTIGAGGGGVFMFYVPYKFQKKFYYGLNLSFRIFFYIILFEFHP